MHIEGKRTGILHEVWDAAKRFPKTPRKAGQLSFKNVLGLQKECRSAIEDTRNEHATPERRAAAYATYMVAARVLEQTGQSARIPRLRDAA